MPTTTTPWPSLPYNAWEPTCSTLHMWTQIIGKTRLALTPLQNHWWNVPLYVTARGLTTSAMPCGNNQLLDIEFDLISHQLHYRLSTGEALSRPLRPQSVADFYREYQQSLATLNLTIPINPMPCELAAPIRFDLDTTHHSYDPDYAHRFWQIISLADVLFRRYSTNFLGKISPVHFFWGSFDLAVTRFCGRPAPPRPGADSITREAYSHEVISAGFWPGNGGFGEPAFYCYAAPSPEGLAETPIQPPQAAWNPQLGEFILKYEDLRLLPNPEQAVLDFLQSTYAAAADRAKWDRLALERQA
jgi:Family of unknown function (DUF5996)